MREEIGTNKKENKQIILKFEELQNSIEKALKMSEELNSKLQPIKISLPKPENNIKEKSELSLLCPFAEVINIEIIKINQIIYMLKNNLEEIQF